MTSLNMSDFPALLSKSRILSEGKDCTLIVTGGILEEAQKARALLKDKGISIKILNIHTIKPLDVASIINAYKSTDAIVTLEEHTLNGGLGSAVAEIIADYGLAPKKFLRIGLNDEFSSIVGSQQYLRECYKMDSISIKNRILKLLKN